MHVSASDLYLLVVLVCVITFCAAHSSETPIRRGDDCPCAPPMIAILGIR